MYKRKALIFIVSAIMVISGMSVILFFNGNSLKNPTDMPTNHPQISNALPSLGNNYNQFDKPISTVNHYAKTNSINIASGNNWYSLSANLSSKPVNSGVSAQIKTSSASQQNLYKVNFTEKGIQAGITWQVEVYKDSSNFPPFLEKVYNVTFSTYMNSSSTMSMLAYLPNGTYYYYAGQAGTFLFEDVFSVSGAPMNLSISFPVFYKVTISESGLPGSTSWGAIAFNATDEYELSFYNFSSSEQIVSYLPNGTYEFLAGPSSSYILQSNITINGGSKNLNVNFPTLYKITLAGKNITPRSQWSILANNSADSVVYINSSIGSTIIAYLPNGTYFYGALIGNLVTPSYSVIGTSGKFTVSGEPKTITISFPVAYRVTFTEENVRPGQSWSIYAYNTNNSAQYSNETTNTSMTVLLLNGTYAYNAYTGSLHIGPVLFNVSGVQETVTVVFPVTYNVTFAEENLHPGQSWSIYAYSSNFSVQYSNETTNTSMIAFLPNGTYTYNAYTGSLHIGPVQFNVSGVQETITVVFPVTYKITFTEKNVRPGQSWSISAYNSNNSVQYYNTTSGTSMIAFLPNDTYAYNAYTGSLHIGPVLFNVSGVQETVTVVFPVTYNVTFAEENLHPGQSWSISAYNSNNSVQYYNTTSGTSMIAFLPNGTYNYSAFLIRNTTNLHVGPVQFNVSGVQETITVVFPVTYKVTFTEENLHPGQYWSIYAYNFNDSIQYYNATSGTSMIAFLPNDTYNYSASSFENLGETHFEVLRSFNVSGAQETFIVVFPATYKVTFTEENLHPGQSWSIYAYNFNDSIQYNNETTDTSMTALLPNGTYNYTVGYHSSLSYIITPANGTIKMEGRNISIQIVFTEGFPVFFNEVGIPSSNEWSSFDSTLLRTMENNTAPPAKFVNATMGFNSTGMSMSGPSGDYQVTGIQTTASYSGPINVWVNASALGGTAEPVIIILQNSNLSNYLYVSEDACVNNAPYNGTYLGYSGGGGTSHSSSLLYNAPRFNMVYTYELTISNGYGSIKIFSSGKLLASESGLYVGEGPFYLTLGQKIGSPATGPIPTKAMWISASIYNNTTGSSLLNTNFNSPVWGVEVNGNLYESVTNSTLVYLTNGTYNYTIQGVEYPYSAPNQKGTLTVSGTGISLNLVFAYSYKVTFTESGLPGGSSWSVTINGITNTSTSSVITFMEPNGTYSYTIATTNPAYGASSSSGSAKVIGANASVAVTFTELTFTITFTESGLASGTTWYLNLSDGKTLSSNTTTITVSLVNGTYSYAATASGYLNKTGSVTLNDSSQSVIVTFSKVSTTSSSTNNDLIYIAVGVVAAVVVIAGAVLALRRKK